MTEQTTTSAAQLAPLTIDLILREARRPERTAVICLAGDLEDEHRAVLEEIASRVTPDGELIRGPEDSLAGDAGVEAVETLLERERELVRRMRDHTYRVLFRGMPDDDWKVFCRRYRDGNDQIKDLTEHDNALIAACAVDPVLSADDVVAMRGKLTQPQMQTLANEAYYACTTGGVDIPKSPTYLSTTTPDR